VIIEHAKALNAALPDGLHAQSSYPAKIKPGMICVLTYQVKVKYARNCCKSVEKSTENNRNL